VAAWHRPLGEGPFIRARNGEPELVVGTWALVGDNDKKPINRPRMTNCARWEGIAQKPTYKGSWLRGQRCLIPAERFDYPTWESGKNEWWTFRRADGQPWHLAGIWNTWTSPKTGEVFESYSMLTQNCDTHLLLSRFHKPEPTLAPDAQDKRTVVPLEMGDFRTWLNGTNEEAARLVRLPPVDLYDAVPDRISPLPAVP
jgi:putative SOS response-associated peptidase YedK